MRPSLPFYFLFAVVAAGCASPEDAESTVESEAVATGGPYFEIHALGDRCVDAGLVNSDGVGNLVIRPCTGAITQVFRFGEIDTASHDVIIAANTSSRCIAMEGTAVAGRRLALRPCAVTPAQRFAWDGDALMMGTQLGINERVNRDFVIETLEADTRSNTPVVLGHRDLNDAEYWWLKPVGNALYPHSGFVKVGNEFELAQALHDARWGTVIEAAPATTDDIWLTTIPTKQVVHEGVTLRGNRKKLFNGTRLVVPNDRVIPPIGDEHLLRLEDHARVTGLRIEGNDTGGGSAGVWGLIIGDPVPHTEAPNAIIDHVDISHTSESSIVVWGAHEDLTFPYDRFSCAFERDRGEPRGKIVGNFIHHSKEYGFNVGAGGSALVTGNLMFKHTHDITASFHTTNRYLAYDNLFTGEVGGHVSAIFDIHGSCSIDSLWDGGRAGDYFDVGWNSFLTTRSPTFSIRGTPCDHAEFHDNVSTEDMGSERVKVETAPSPDRKDPTDCVDPSTQQEFVPRTPDTILLQSNNRASIRNPLRSCPRRNGMKEGSCYSGDFAVGDFDGDGIDDLFFGSGVTWWYSSGGTAEWRFLSRKNELSSNLRFGDLDADGRTDVIAFNGRNFEVSWAGVSGWFPLNTMNLVGFDRLRIDDVAVGYFDSRPGADLFISNGSAWRISSQGSGAWVAFGGLGFRTSQLRFADFDGDHRTDVFAVVGNQWRIWNAGLNQNLFLSLAPVTNIDELVVAGFRDTNKADVAYFASVAPGGFWMVSRGGNTTPVPLRWSADPLITLPIGQFDGQPGADVLHWSDDRWLVLSSSGNGDDKTWSRQSMR